MAKDKMVRAQGDTMAIDKKALARAKITELVGDENTPDEVIAWFTDNVTSAKGAYDEANEDVSVDDWDSKNDNAKKDAINVIKGHELNYKKALALKEGFNEAVAEFNAHWATEEQNALNQVAASKETARQNGFLLE